MKTTERKRRKGENGGKKGRKSENSGKKIDEGKRKEK